MSDICRYIPMYIHRKGNAVPVVGIRELSRDTSRVIKRFENTGEPIVVTREGRPIGALVRVDDRQLENLVLATIPGYAEARTTAQEAEEEGRTQSPDEVAEELGMKKPSRLGKGERGVSHALVASVAGLAGVSDDEAAIAVDSILGVLRDTLSRGEEIHLPGFGKFTVAERGAPQGVNPRTGERTRKPPSRVPRFSADAKLTRAVKGR